MALWVHQQVLRLDIAVTIAKRVDVGQSSERLISVQLDQERRNGLLHFIVVLEDSVDCLRYVVHYHIQIYFILL